MTPLVKEFHYNVPIAEVWNALITPDKMKHWYFPPDHPHFHRERFDQGWDNLLGQNLKLLLHSAKS